jgi:hypothetical protein
MYPLPEPISANRNNYISVPEYVYHIFCVPYQREPRLIIYTGFKGVGKRIQEANK